MGKLVANIIVEIMRDASVQLLWRDERRAQSDRSSTQNSEIEWMSVRQEVAEEFTKQAGPPVADRSTAVAGSGGRRSLQLINRIFEANRRRAADHPDCKSNHSRRIEVRFHPRGRPQAGLSRLRRDPCRRRRRAGRP